MGLITGSDEDLHYEDGSHRWIPPLGMDPAWWRRLVQAHVDRHGAGEELPRDGTPPPTSGPTPRPTP